MATQVEPHRIANTSTYDSEPHVVETNDGTLVVVYRTAPSGGAVDNDGKIIARQSTDDGVTWGSEITVADDANYDTRNPSLVYDSDSDRLVVNYRVYDAGSGSNQGEYFRTSTSNGSSWSSRQSVSLSYATGSSVAPFGGHAQTSNGLITMWYGLNANGGYGVVEAVFSTDGGQSWGNNVKVVDTTSTSGRTTVEPVPTAYTDDKLWTWGRDNATGDFWVVQSSDGGSTWGSPVYCNPTGMSDSSPIQVKRTNANELTAVWGDRTNDYVQVVNASARLLWQDPTLLADEPVRRLHNQIGSGNGFGYPTFTQLGRDRRNTVVAFYDEDTEPNVWVTSLD